MPGYRVRVACEHLADASLAGDELLMSMVEALTVFDQNASIANGCLDITGRHTVLMLNQNRKPSLAQ